MIDYRGRGKREGVREVGPEADGVVYYRRMKFNSIYIKKSKIHIHVNLTHCSRELQPTIILCVKHLQPQCSPNTLRYIGPVFDVHVGYTLYVRICMHALNTIHWTCLLFSSSITSVAFIILS